MEIEEGVAASTDNTLRDLHNSSCDTKAELNSLIVLLFIQNNFLFKNIVKTCLPPSMLSSSLIVYVFSK